MVGMDILVVRWKKGPGKENSVTEERSIHVGALG